MTKQTKKQTELHEHPHIHWWLMGVGGFILFAFAVSLTCRNMSLNSQSQTVLGKYDLEIFDGIDTIRSEKDKDLVDEFDKIITSSSTKGLPVGIFRNVVPANANIASYLSHQFSLYHEEANQGELDPLRKARPDSDWAISPETRQSVDEILKRTEERRQFIREKMKVKDICYAIELVLHKKSDKDPGTLEPDWEAASYLDDYLLLEEFAIAKSLHEGKIDDAIDALQYLFQLARLAAEVELPEVREKVAQMRRRTVRIMQAVVLDKNCQTKDMIRLYDILKIQLERWAPDEKIWIGARAYGMLTFEAVRANGLVPILGEKAVDEASRHGFLDRYLKNMRKSIASDYVFYLRSMSAIIDSCRDIYPARQKVLDAIDADIQERLHPESEKGAFPIIADFLLIDIRGIMEICAMERAEYEAAFIAVAMSVNRSTDSLQDRNSFDGKPFEVTTSGDATSGEPVQISVTFDGAEQPFIAPKKLPSIK